MPLLRTLMAVGLLLAPASVSASPFSQSGDMRWVVLASRQSEEEAIGVARVYSRQFPTIRVFQATNGWYAIAAGPERVTNARVRKEQLITSSGAPKDLLFSRGDGYIAQIWAPQPFVPAAHVKYDGSRPAVATTDGLSLTVASKPDKDGMHVASLTLSRAGQTLLRVALDDNPGASPNAEATVLRLDSSTPEPQVVFTSHWGGAHCCTMTKIAAKVSGAWRVIEGKTLDGEGYAFDDIDGDGTYELINVDNSFLYQFASYAESAAPRQISKLMEGKLVDVTNEPRFQSYLRQQLYGLEHWASLDPSIWRSNGFLGGWVATKALVGQFDEAWSRMLPLYDRNSDWTMTECTVPEVKGVCPAGHQRSLDFPVALRKHLESTGYIPSSRGRAKPEAAVVATLPVPVQPEPKPTPPSHRNGSSSGTGFFISQDGHIVTNAHVVADCRSLTVRPSGGSPVSARVLARDRTNDLALLETGRRAEKSASIRLATRLGEPVAVFGFPLTQVLASSGNFTLGNITALAGIGDDSRYFQLSAPVQPGNSGGPLLDEAGNVIGVVTAKLDALRTLVAVGDVPQNVNFAIKATVVSAFLEGNRVSANSSPKATKLSPPDLADEANAISVHIVCD